MRVWNRHYVVDGRQPAGREPRASDIYDNVSMQACRGAACVTRDDFFAECSRSFPRRYQYYHKYLIKNIKKDQRGLSIGSGQCVDELRLLDKGYDIQCSDLQESFSEEVKRLFPEFKFTRLDISQMPFSSPVDYVMALSVLYCFDQDQLQKVFQNVADSLKRGGCFFADFGGAADNLFTSFLDNFLCPNDAKVQYFIKKFFLRKDVRLVKTLQGYRFREDAVIALAQEAGFVLDDIERYDHVTELKDRLLVFNRLPDPVVSCFGQGVPYVRFFKFTKA